LIGIHAINKREMTKNGKPTEPIPTDPIPTQIEFGEKWENWADAPCIARQDLAHIGGSTA
jgi:hypothetical protein